MAEDRKKLVAVQRCRQGPSRRRAADWNTSHQRRDMMRSSLESPAYVANMLQKWRCRPKSMIVIEYLGDGDQAFGGAADDRSLGRDGQILPRRSNELPAVFLTIEAAQQAAQAVSNRRVGSILGVAPSWH